MTTLKENSFPGMPPERANLVRMMDAVIFDLDNCLADDSHRLSLIIPHLSGDEKYHQYHRLCFADKYHRGHIAVLLDELESGATVFFSTARPERYRKLSVWWLQQLPHHGLLSEDDISARLVMRPVGDVRPTVEIKRQTLRAIEDLGYNVVRAYDDRQDVVSMYRAESVDGVRMMIHDIPDCEAPRVEHISAAADVLHTMSDEAWPVQGARRTKHAPHAEHAVLRRLREAIQTFESRNKQYGGNNESFGAAFLSLFPGGKLPEINTVEDMNRLQVLMQLFNKLMRYAANFQDGGHVDSAHDAIVYSAMLEAFTK